MLCALVPYLTLPYFALPSGWAVVTLFSTESKSVWHNVANCSDLTVLGPQPIN